MNDRAVASFITAPQHGPRPLPLFLSMLHQNGAASPERIASALAGLRAYQDAPRHEAGNTVPAYAAAGRARMLDFGGAADGAPVVLVPSLINPHSILDMGQRSSLARYLAAAGHRTFLIDWGHPTAADRDQSLGDHVTGLLLPMLAQLDRPPVLVGYCLGGTLALAAAMLHPVAGVALIAAPWRFDGYGERARADIASGWRDSRAACDALGLVPMEVLQAGFWRIDPERTIDKYVRFGTLPPDSDAARKFVLLEDWANAGAPLTLAAGRELFDDLISADASGRGAWSVGGQTVMPGAISCPMVEFVSTNDRIVPAASAIGLEDQRRLTAGHVGMVVGSRAAEQLWVPLSDWLSGLADAR
ncbi:alpha/beta fold hydrolase [Sphingomonas sp. FW199]|uniref:alpha/beta fold hydrolase n=1 Tax=Sphingomonas sp. FW199 TaxID=3400217 RepID=UPI003CEADEFB